MPRKTTDEITALNNAVDQFAIEMKAKLIAMMLEDDRHGWDDPSCLNGIRQSLAKKVTQGDDQAIDMANYAMMIWWINVGLPDQQWDDFGYLSKMPCCVCGQVDATKSEPRFGYVVCKKHSTMSPIQIDSIRTDVVR